MFYNSSNEVKHISPSQLNGKIRKGEDFFLLDVRTPGENVMQAIPCSYLIPLQELQHRLQEIPKNKEIVVYCSVGNRSACACVLLGRYMYNVKNLEGGIRLWNTVGHALLARAL